MSRLATLTLTIDVTCISDYACAPAIASEMLAKMVKLQQSLDSDYGYTVVRQATVVDGEE